MSNLLKNWDIMRITRLVAGVASAVYAVTTKEYIFLLLAVFFLFQAVLNISCCGAGGCSTTDSQKPQRLYQDDIEQYRADKK